VTVTLFCLAGAARLQAKADGALRDQMGAAVRPLTLATVAGVAVSAALLPVATSARLDLGAVDRWLPFGYAVLVAAAGFWTAWRRAGRTPDWIPFAAVTATEAAGLVALLALYYPQVVPP
jgi:cytochrome bd-type quinol oxidase subunit 2